MSDEVSATYDSTGIDFFGQIARTLIRHARLREGAAVLDLGCGAVGDAEAPPVNPGSVDAIVASLVLFFLPNIDLALDAYARALVTGGTLAFSTLGGGDDWAPLERLLTRFVPEAPQADDEAWFATSAGISSLLGAHGFDHISIEEVTHQVEFPTAAAFHEWIWSTGYREIWSAVSPNRRESARAAVDDYLDSLRERRGCLRFATAVRYTRAKAT